MKISVAAKVRTGRMRHKYAFMTARLRRIPKRERGAFIQRAIRDIAVTCIRFDQPIARRSQG